MKVEVQASPADYISRTSCPTINEHSECQFLAVINGGETGPNLPKGERVINLRGNTLRGHDLLAFLHLFPSIGTQLDVSPIKNGRSTVRFLSLCS